MEVLELKNFDSNLCKQGSMEGETKERAVQRRKVVGSLRYIKKERTVSMEVKMGLCEGIIFLTITYTNETWV